MWVLWHSVDDLELIASRSNICKVVEDMLSVIHITYEEIQPFTYEKQQVEKSRKFFKEMPAAAILFSRMRLISVPEKLTSH